MDPFIYYFLVLLSFLILLKIKKGNVRIPQISLPLIFFSLIFAFSIFYHSPFLPITKIVGALYHFYWWVNGFLLLLIIANVKINLKKEIYKITLYLLSSSILIVIISLLIFLSTGNSSMEIPTLMVKCFPKWNIVAEAAHTSTLRLYATTELISFNLPRVSFLMYPLASGQLLILLLPIMWGFSYLYEKRKKMIKLIAGISFLPLFFTLSRTPVASLLVVFFIFGMSEVVKKVKEFPLRKKQAILFAFLVLSLPLTVFFVKLFRFMFLKLRPGSFILRVAQYKKALEIFYSHPLFGVGALYTDPTLPIRVGTHSTYIEILMLTGILGFVFFMMFQMLVLEKWLWNEKRIKNREEKAFWKFYGMGIFSLLLSLLGGTLIDFYPVFSMILFLVFGILLNPEKKEEVK